MKLVSRLAIAYLAAAALAACGEPDDDWNESSNRIGGNDAGRDVGNDADDSGDGGSNSDGGADTDASEDAGPPPSEGTSCAEPTDLGELDLDTHTFDSALLEPHESLGTSCEQDEAGSGVRVLSFEPASDSRLQIWSTASPSQYDLRAGGCAEPDEILSCSTTGSAGADLDAGQTYHLVLWGDSNQRDFELELTPEALVCNPDDADWCDNGQMHECRSSTRLETAACIDACADNARCTADSCTQAIDVDLAAASSMSVTGQLAAYSDTWNAAQLDDGQCAFPDAAANPDTPNADTFFNVRGLSAGQLLTVESTLSGDFAFFVLDACNADTCLTAFDDDELGDQRIEWEVPADGSYLLVVEPLSSRDRDFAFSFTVE